MKDYSVSLVNTNGVVFPGTLAINASGPSATDGTEWVKVFIDDYMGARQDLMVEAGKTPSGNDEAVGSSDFVAALKSLLWFNNLITGLVSSNNVTDSDHDIDVSVGQAMDSSNAYLMKLTSGLVKQIDSSWAVGTNAGGLFTGTVAIDTLYYIFAIRKDSDGSIDVGFDTDSAAANIPGGYTAFRRIGYVITDGSANILNYTVLESAGGALEYEWVAVQNAINEVATVATLTLTSIASPPGTIALLSTHLGWVSGTVRLWVASTSFTDAVPVVTNQDLMVTSAGSVNDNFKRVAVDSSSQVAYRASVTTGLITLGVRGYIDTRL